MLPWVRLIRLGGIRKPIMWYSVWKDEVGEKIITNRTKRIVRSLVQPSLKPSRKRTDYFGKRLITLKRSCQKRLIAQFFNIQNLKQMILLQDSYTHIPMTITLLYLPTPISTSYWRQMSSNTMVLPMNYTRWQVF